MLRTGSSFRYGEISIHLQVFTITRNFHVKDGTAGIGDGAVVDGETTGRPGRRQIGKHACMHPLFSGFQTLDPGVVYL